MKKVITFIILTGMLFSMSGCFNLNAYNEAASQHEGESDIYLDDAQKNLLISTGGDANELDNGNLTSTQKEIINRYNFTMDYLQNKYPDHTFLITWYTPDGLWNPQARFTFTCDGADKEYTVNITVTEGDGGNTYEAEDNFSE